MARILNVPGERGDKGKSETLVASIAKQQLVHIKSKMLGQDCHGSPHVGVPKFLSWGRNPFSFFLKRILLSVSVFR